jgi:hypothetical protein
MVCLDWSVVSVVFRLRVLDDDVRFVFVAMAMRVHHIQLGTFVSALDGYVGVRSPRDYCRTWGSFGSPPTTLV